MTNSEKEMIPLRQYSSPRYWPTWLGLWSMWLLAQLPFSIQIRLGQLLGYLTYLFARRRRTIAHINLELCFPEMSQAERKRLLRDSFIANGVGLFEVAIAWYRDLNDFSHLVTVEGLENLQEAKNRGNGVLLVCAHFSTLELAGSLLSLFTPFDVTFRKHKNQLLQAVMTNYRQRLFANVIERKQVRDALRSLKRGRVVWYAPDQDYGPKHSVFVPFFGAKAATITLQRAASRPLTILQLSYSPTIENPTIPAMFSN